MNVILTIVKKELLQTLRDTKLRLVIFVMPVLQTIVFGFAISTDVKNIPVSICEEQSSFSSRKVISLFQDSEYFHIVHLTNQCSDIMNDIDFNQARIALIIPANFQKQLSKGLDAPLQVLVDGSDGNTANIAMGYITRMLAQTPFKVYQSTSGFTLAGVTPPPFQGISMEPRVWFNPDMESKFFLLPGILVMILTIIVTLLTAMAITREKEIGTFEQLAVSPIAGWQLILGKTLPFLFIGILDLVVIAAVGRLVFSLQMQSSLDVFLGVNTTFILTMLGMGLFISTISSSQGQAMMTVFAILFPFIILGDFFFPVENMPQAIQYIAMGNPIRYAMVAQREIFLRGSSWDKLAPSALILLGFAFIFLAYGAFRFRKSLTS